MTDEQLNDLGQSTVSTQMTEAVMPKNQPPLPSKQPEFAAQPIGPDKDNVKAPLLVKIIAWLLLIGGIFGTIFSAFFFVGEGNIFDSSFIPAFINLLGNILLIVAFFGLIRMKKWAVFILTATTISEIAFSLIYGQDYIVSIINIIILAYLWIINKQFR